MRHERKPRFGRDTELQPQLVPFLVVCLMAAVPAANPMDRVEDIDAYVQAEMELNQIPGLSLAIVQGSTVDSRRYGVKNVETLEAMEADTPVDLASVSKPLTALAILQLHESGRLELDAPVIRYLPELAASDSWLRDTPSVRDLLRHKSGLSRQADHLVPCCGLPGASDLGLAVRRLASASRQWPRKVFRYANSNYVLLAAIIERDAGERFPAHMRVHVFEPLGLHQTTLDRSRARRWGPAAYHERQWGRVRLSPSNFSGWQGSSGVISTARDLGRFIVAMLGEQGAFVSSHLQEPDAAKSPYEAFYDLGWSITPQAEWLNGARIWEHSGDIWGANTAIALAPGLQAGVGVLANVGAYRAGAIARGLLARSLRLPAPAPGRTPWHQIPDNAAIASIIAAAAILVGMVVYLARVRRQFHAGRRQFRWSQNGLAWARAVLLVAMAAYLTGLLFFGSTPLVAYPATLRTAVPLLTTTVVLLLLSQAILSFAPGRQKK